MDTPPAGSTDQKPAETTPSENPQTPPSKPLDESAVVTSRKALITTLISIALSPFAILAGYYVGKVLSSPRLTIQYVRADPERESLKIRTDVLQVIQSDLGLAAMVKEKVSSDCGTWISDGKLTRTCLSETLNALDQLAGVVSFEEKIATDNITAITSWNPQTELVLVPILVPGVESQHITELARQDKKRAVEIFRGYVKALELKRSELNTLKTELRQLDPKTQRTGRVTFRVGVLNAGDADGVVFPDATLAVIDMKIPLLRKASPEDRDGKFTVIKAHSFEDVPFEVNEGRSEREALSKWQDLVKKETQEKFTIILKSPGEFDKEGRLPN